MKLFSEVQKIGKALMTPIAILPAAGLLLAFGNKLNLPIMEQAGQIIFSNLPLLFAIGAAIGLVGGDGRSEEHTSELQSRQYLVCRLLLEKKTNNTHT